MLQLQARLLLVQAYEETKDSKLVAQMFKVTRRSVIRLYKQYKEPGSIETRTHLRGHKSKITEVHRQKSMKFFMRCQMQHSMKFENVCT